MGRARAFLYILICFLVGVGTRSVVNVPSLVVTAVAGTAVVSTLVCWRQRRVRVISLCVLLFVVGILRYASALPRFDAHHIRVLNGTGEVMFTGVVSDEPDMRMDHTKLTIRVISARENIPMHGRVLVRTGLYPEYQYGDELKITCSLRTPERFEDFAYDAYLARYDIYSLCSLARIVKTGEGKGNSILSAILSAKQTFVNHLSQVVPEPEASFLNGLVLGAKRSLPAALTEAFQITGTSHLVALSGFNITIIGVFIDSCAKVMGIGRYKRFWVSIIGIAFFILMTGAQASVVRAGIMGSLALLARRVGRLSRVTNALVLAAALMVAVNPKILIFDAGFQLSFLATLGLIYLSPSFEKVFARLPNTCEIRATLVATFAAMTMTLPFIAVQFGRISLIAPLVNLIVVPLVPYAMAAGFAAGIASIVWLPAGAVIGTLAWLVLRLMLFVIETAAQVPHASLAFPNVPASWMVGIYALFAVMFVIIKNKKRPRGDVACPAA